MEEWAKQEELDHQERKDAVDDPDHVDHPDQLSSEERKLNRLLARLEMERDPDQTEPEN